MEFTLGNAYFCTLHGNLTPEEEEQGFTVSENGNILVPDEFAEKVQREMEKMRDRGSAITKKTYPLDDAIALFNRQGMQDKVQLFHMKELLMSS